MNNLYKYCYVLTKKDFRTLLKRLYSTEYEYLKVELLKPNPNYFNSLPENDEDFDLSPIENYISNEIDQNFIKELKIKLNKIAERINDRNVSIKKVHFGRLYRLISNSAFFEKIQDKRRYELFDEFLNGKRKFIIRGVNLLSIYK